MTERRKRKRATSKSSEKINRSLDELEAINVDELGFKVVDKEEFAKAWKAIIEELRKQNNFLDDLELHLRD